MIDEQGGGRPGGPGFGRIALIAAGIVAAGAIGVSTWRARPEIAPAAPAAAAPAAAAPDARTSEASAKLADVIVKLEARMKASPGDATGWRMLGWAYYQTQRYPDAQIAYRRATAADPANAEGWSALGEVIALAGNGEIPAEAAAAFRKAVAIDPGDARARYFLAVQKDLAGDHQGAIDGWIALLKDTPAGAPWEANVRETIAQAARKYDIDVAARMPPSAPAAASPGPAADAAPAPTPGQIAAATSLPPGQQGAMVRGMVDGLSARLRKDPGDRDGWIRLMRARMVLGDKAAATAALRAATEAFAGNTGEQRRIAAAADALGVPRE